MTNREVIISLALKYQGSYDRIKYAISSKEDVEHIPYENAITIFDEDYPKELFSLKSPPFVLFYKGNKKLLRKEKIAVVGSRKPCDYALDATRALVLSKKDKVIISGLAKGIDAQAHRCAKRTIGILGCGIDYVYPKENAPLYKKIEEEGLILSEYPGYCVPYPYNFPFRNRIIAALAEEVYIMEAHEKSGTLTTINEALELGRNIKVLPYDVFVEEGKYNNYLINEGAMMIDISDLSN